MSICKQKLKAFIEILFIENNEATFLNAVKAAKHRCIRRCLTLSVKNNFFSILTCTKNHYFPHLIVFF